MTQLNGKTAIVTGSTSGIGAGIAESLAAAGCHVVLNGFGEAETIRTQMERMRAAYGVEVIHSSADMGQAEAIHTMVQETANRFGSVDVLVNNAGIQHVDPVEKFPLEKWNAVIAINLSAAFHAIHAAVPHMKAQGWGRILNIASAHGLVASANKSAYVAAKHGMVGLTKSVALELATTQITCNAICPGWVLTPLVWKQVEAKAESLGISLAEAEKQLLSEKQPSQRFVQPEELGALAVFLCGEMAGSITGTAISMDGGWTAQ